MVGTTQKKNPQVLKKNKTDVREMLRTLPNRDALNCKATLKHVNKLILGHSYSVAS